MTKLKVSSPAELLSAVPFLVGFHPADSLVVVAMHGPRITFAVRIDLPEHGTPEEEARAAVLHLATVVMQQQAEAATIIGYGEESRVTPAVLRISDAFRKARLTIVDELRVTDGRYWSYLCQDLSCCPPEGRLCEPAYSVVATEATYAGAVALPSREALAGQLTPVTGDDREAMTVATARALLRLAALASERRPAPDIPGDEAPSDPQRSATDRAQPSTVPGGENGEPQHPFNDQLWMSTDVSSNLLRPEPRDEAADPSEPFGSDAPEPLHFHDQKAAHLMAATSAIGRPGPAELRLSNVIWASLGIAPPVPDELPQPAEPGSDGPGSDGPGSDGPGSDAPESESAPRGSALLSDEDYFFARVRSVGRTAVREAERCYSSGGRLTDDDAAWLGVLLLHMPVRDYAWTRTRTHEWELALWSDLTRRVEARFIPAPASLLAFVAWRMGLGPLASVAVERALDQKLNYSLANLMQGALITGLPPSVLDGWPAVAGLPPIDDGFDSEDDPWCDAPVHARPTVVTEVPAGGMDHVSRPARRDLAEPDGPGMAKSKGRDSAEPEDSDSTEPADQDRPVETQLKSRDGTESDLNRSGGVGQLPVHVRSDVAPADARNGAGDGPGRRDKRPQKTRRASRRRL